MSTFQRNLKECKSQEYNFHFSIWLLESRDRPPARELPSRPVSETPTDLPGNIYMFTPGRPIRPPICVLSWKDNEIRVQKTDNGNTVKLQWDPQNGTIKRETGILGVSAWGDINSSVDYNINQGNPCDMSLTESVSVTSELKRFESLFLSGVRV